MSRALITESYLTGIANAIRAKNGSSDTYTPPQMAAAIQAIPTGGITPTGTLQITQNGTHDVTQYANANVNVQPKLQSKTVTQNGTVTPDQGYDGLSSVVVNVSGGGVDTHFKKLTPIVTDFIGGYVSSSVWYVNDTTSRSDIYQLEENKRYIIMLGDTIDNRFRTAVFQSNPANATSRLNGTSIRDFSGSDVKQYMIATVINTNQPYVADSNNYLAITKTNQSVDGINSYVFELLF